MIELLDSDSELSSDGSDNSGEEDEGSLGKERINASNDSAQSKAESNGNNSDDNEMASDDDGNSNDNNLNGVRGDGFATSGDFFEPDYNFPGEDDSTGEIEEYHKSKIQQSKLFTAAQGFRTQATAQSTANAVPNSPAATKDYEPFDPDSATYCGNTFHRNKCYITQTDKGEVTVGIKRFISNEEAECVLIREFEDTLLGVEEEGSGYKLDDDMRGTHVQIYKCIKNLSLSKLTREAEDVAEIPSLIYQPQSEGDWHTFGYFYDRTQMQRKGRREGGLRSLECFAGAGGSLIGYKNNGFETVMAIENNSDAVRTLKENNKDLKVYEGCMKQFIQEYETSDLLKDALGKIDHVSAESNTKMG